MSVQFIRTPHGDELAVLPREDYEDLIDATAGQRAADALAAGTEESLSTTEMRALLAAPTPLVFWREKRGVASGDMARRLEISGQELIELEAGRRIVPLSVYRKAAEMLSVSLEDLATD